MSLQNLTKDWTEQDFKKFWEWTDNRLKKNPEEWWFVVDISNRRLKAKDRVRATYTKLAVYKRVQEFDKKHHLKRRWYPILMDETLTKETANRLNSFFDQIRKKIDLPNERLLSAILWGVIYLKRYTHDASPEPVKLEELLDSTFLEFLLKGIPKTLKELPTRYPREYMLTFPELIDSKKQIIERERGGEIELWGTLPPLAHPIALTYYYFVDPRDPRREVTKTPKEWLEALSNSKYYFSELKKAFSGFKYKQFDEVTSLMAGVKHSPIWRQGWVTEYDRSGRPRREKRAWKFEGALMSKRVEYYLEKGQNVNQMSPEEKEKLRVKTVTLRIADPYLLGLTHQGIGYTLAYHKEIMDLFHRLGKNWLAKEIFSYMFAQASMVADISKGKLLRWCYSGRPEYLKTRYSQCLQRLKQAIKRLEREGVFEKIEKIPYKYKNELGETYFDRYYKSSEYFIPTDRKSLEVKNAK